MCASTISDQSAFCIEKHWSLATSSHEAQSEDRPDWAGSLKLITVLAGNTFHMPAHISFGLINLIILFRSEKYSSPLN